MVGDSRLVHKGIVEVLRAKWATARGSKPSLHDLLLCGLRRQLLMLMVANRSEHVYRCALATRVVVLTGVVEDAMHVAL
jgi:hypothetical protein